MVSKKAEKFFENESHTKFITFSIRIIVKALTIQTQDTTVHCTDLRKSIYVFQRLNGQRMTQFLCCLFAVGLIPVPINTYVQLFTQEQRGQCILLSVVFTPPPPATTARQCLAPTCHLSTLN